jgi:mRNA-degrading endonuclease RelE of RelBE toxin-antitoxin system
MWKVEYKKRFLKELSKLPEDIQVQSEKMVFKDLIVRIRSYSDTLSK